MVSCTLNPHLLYSSLNVLKIYPYRVDPLYIKRQERMIRIAVCQNKILKRFFIKAFTLILTLCALSFSTSWAIVDNETSASAQIHDGWSRKFRFSHSSSSGNTDTLILGASFGIEHHRLFTSSDTVDSTGSKKSYYSDPNQFQQRFRILGSYDLQETNDEKVKNVSYLHTRWTDMWNNTLGYEVFMQNEFNEFKRINNRLLLGFGLRADIYRTSRTGFWVGSGYMYESKKLDVDDFPGEDDSEINHRWANYLTWIKRFDENRFMLQNTLYYQPAFEDFEDYELFNNFNASYRINKTVSVGMQVLYQYDSLPPTSIEKADRQIKSFITVSF